MNTVKIVVFVMLILLCIYRRYAGTLQKGKHDVVNYNTDTFEILDQL